MILLYESGEAAFADNGLGALPDAVSCTVTEARNGEFELAMEYPLSGLHYADLLPRRLITAPPRPGAGPQPFRIYRITRPLNGRVTVYAQHVSYDLSGVVAGPFTAGSAQAAMAALQEAAEGAGFSFFTDIASTAEMRAAVPSSVRSLLGGTEGSLLDTYGGEYEWDGFTVRLLSRRGQDSGVTIRYGKNLTALQQDEDVSGTATAVYPYWAGQDGTLVTLPEKTVAAPGEHDYKATVPLDLSGEFTEQPTAGQLRERAEQYVQANNPAAPAVSLSVSFQPLDQTEEYKDLALLERVNLCDTVTVEYPALGVEAAARCVKTVYDVLRDRYTSVELGDARVNIADTVARQQQEIEKAPTASAMQQAILNATNAITGNKGGYVVLRDGDGDGEPDEILIMDSPDVLTAQRVWRWNSGGLGYSSGGYNGPYGTAITQDGAIVADFITAGSLNAGVIKSGRIVGQANPNVYFDLDAGELAASEIVDPNGGAEAVIGTQTVGGQPSQGLEVRLGEDSLFLSPGGIGGSGREAGTAGLKSFSLAFPGLAVDSNGLADYTVTIGAGGLIITDNALQQQLVQISGSRIQVTAPGDTVTFANLYPDFFEVWTGGHRVLQCHESAVTVNTDLQVIGELTVNGVPINP